MKPKTLLTLPLTPDATGNVIDANGEHFAMVPILGKFGAHTQEHAKLIAVAVNNFEEMRSQFTELIYGSQRTRGAQLNSALELLAKISKEEQE